MYASAPGLSTRQGINQGSYEPCCASLQAETLSNLLSSTSFGQILTTVLGPSAFGFLAAALMIPTVLLPDLESLSVLGALGVGAAAVVGLTVS